MAKTIQELTKNLQILQSALTDRNSANKTTKALKDMAYYSWKGCVPSMPGEPRNKDKRAVLPDILGFLLKSFSYLYRVDPVRSCEDVGSQEIFQDKLWTFGDELNAKMCLADQLVRLSGTCLIKVAWNQSPSGDVSLWPSADGYQLEIYTPEMFSTCGDNALYPEYLMVKAASGWEYWDKEIMVPLTNRFEVKKDSAVEHNFGILPFVVVQNVAAWPDTIAPRMGGDDLHHTIRNIGGMIREMGWTALLQRGQPWVSGDVRGQIVLAPDALVQVELGSTFAIVPNNANLPGMMSVLETLLNTFATCLGLPSRIFKLAPGAALSGIAIQLDRQELEADRQQRVSIFTGVEKRLAYIVAHLEVKGGFATPETIKPLINISFRQPEPIITYAERQARVSWLYSEKIISAQFALSDLFTSASVAEIDRWVEAGKEFWEEKGTVQATPLQVFTDQVSPEQDNSEPQ